MAAEPESVASLSPPARDEIIAWIREHAIVIDTVEPSAPLDDLEPLRDRIAGAAVLGLGESVRGARSGRELYRLKHRLARVAVETLGFRTVAFEDTPGVGSMLDGYACSGEGNLDDLLAAAWGPWRTEEFAELVGWLQAFNAAHTGDPVRIVGVDGPDPNALAWNTLRAWESAGQRIVYWGGIGHVVVGRDPASGAISDGWVLRERLGADYLAVGITCHHGTGHETLPPPPEHFAEAILGAAGIERFALDLRAASTNSTVTSWLTSPTATRIIGPRYEPDHDADYVMTNGTLQGWFDVVVHNRQVTPARYLPR